MQENNKQLKIVEIWLGSTADDEKFEFFDQRDKAIALEKVLKHHG